MAFIGMRADPCGASLGTRPLLPQYDRDFPLARGNVPISVEQALFFTLVGDELEAVGLVETDGPDGILPGPDQHRSRGLVDEMREQLRADAAALLRVPDVSVADQRDVAHILQAHHAGQRSVLFP